MTAVRWEPWAGVAADDSATAKAEDLVRSLRKRRRPGVGHIETGSNLYGDCLVTATLQHDGSVDLLWCLVRQSATVPPEKP